MGLGEVEAQRETLSEREDINVAEDDWDTDGERDGIAEALGEGEMDVELVKEEDRVPLLESDAVGVVLIEVHKERL